MPSGCPVPPHSATAIPKSPSKAAHPTKGTMPSASPPWTILKINKKHGKETGDSPVPLPDNGLLHALRFSTISSRLPPPREEPGPCPGSLRFQPSRTAPRCPFRKRAGDRRLPVRGSARHAVNKNTGSGHAYAAPPRPPRRPPLRHHIADFGETAYHSPKNMTDAGPGPERIPRARFPIRRIMAQKGAQKRPEAASCLLYTSDAADE